jgi:hypothetical protein
MKNPTSFSGATPYSRWTPTDKTTTGRSEGKSSNSRGHAHPTRSWKGATSMTYSKPTAASEAIDAIPGATNTHPMLAVKTSEAGPAYGPNSKMVPTPTTGAKTFSMDPKDSRPVKWHKRGYNMDAPSTEGSGKARKKP